MSRCNRLPVLSCSHGQLVRFLRSVRPLGSGFGSDSTDSMFGLDIESFLVIWGGCWFLVEVEMCLHPGVRCVAG